ncbi:MAG: bacteriohemerythrin [Telmatospirillum sp.]|nr:bacteriohemerythrin [Telmatospirillum sp.]
MVTRPLMSWSPDMTVGVAMLDEEHQTLIRLINVLDAIADNGNRVSIETALSELATFAVKHFHDEESFMTRIRYSRLAEHQEQHDEFTTKVQSFLRRLAVEDHSRLVREILQYLEVWWTDHILESDKSFAIEANIA